VLTCLGRDDVAVWLSVWPALRTGH